MKFIKVLIFLLISANSYGQFYTNINTSIYWKQPSGFDKVFIGNDTFQITDNSKRWIAIKNAVLYFHDGSKWTAISGGGGGSYTLPAASPTVLGGIKYSTDFYLNTLAQLAIDTSKRNLWNQVALLPFYAKIDSVRKWLNDTANAHDYVFGSDFTVTGRNVSVNFPAQLTDNYGSSIWPGLTEKPAVWDAKTDYSEFLDSIASVKAIRRDSIFFNRADFLGSGTSLSPISLASNTDVSSTETGLIKPGYVTWSGTGYTYDVTPAIYRVNGLYYTSVAGSVTLDAADGALNRIDAVVVDTFGVVSKITGVAASNPIAPIPNPSSQILLTNITVTPGSSAPSTLNTIVYNEEGNGEYIGSSSGVTSNTANTTFPFSGAKSDNIGPWTSGSTVTFTNGTTASATSYTYLKFFIRLKGVVQNATSISVIFYNGTTAVSKLVSIVNYGINKSLVGSYQNVSVPFSVFGFTSNQFNKIQIRFGGPDGPGCYLDFVQLQNSAVTETGSNVLTDVYIQSGNLYKTVGGNSVLVGAVGGSGGSTDTTSLSNRINANTAAIATKLNIADTANIRLRAVAGANMTITGTYPNLTFNSAGSGGGSQTLQQVTTLDNTTTTDIEITDLTKGIILKSPNGTRARITLNDDLTLTITGL